MNILAQPQVLTHNTPMNIPALMEIVDWLEADAPPRDGVTHFDMGEWIKPNECGVTCCIAGATMKFHGIEPRIVDAFGADFDAAVKARDFNIDTARELLGLNRRTATQLFIGAYPRNKAHTAKVIRYLIETGEVDWSLGADQ